MAPPAPPPLPPAATILNKYQLGRLLGRGSFAKVYEARSIADGSLVAVKIIDKSKTVSAAMEPHILREVQAMRRLQSHPHILRIHEVMATRTKIYLVVELAKGGELLSRIAKGGRLSEAAARRYFHQLVSALRFCHQNGVAHRDVKPQNLLLDESGNLKVSDFGLSALPEQLRNGMLHTACGTPAYTAPEVVSRRRGGYDGAKADAWSCGVILFVFLAGFMPFDDGNLIAMYKKMKRREFHFPAWISKQAKSVVFQLLDPDPERRMSIETLIAHKWFKKTVSSKHQSSYFEIDAILKRYSKTDLSMNAFEIISMSSGLDLSGLFEAASKKEKRFTSIATAEAVAERVKQAGSSLGYSVERGKSGAIGLGKGRLILVVEVMEITTSLVVVEVKVMDGGTEFEEGQWRDLTAALGDVVQSDAF